MPLFNRTFFRFTTLFVGLVACSFLFVAAINEWSSKKETPTPLAEGGLEAGTN